MQSAITRFTPQAAGLKFTNHFSFPSFLKFIADLLRKSPLHLSDVVYGLCGGMVFTALDYFYANKPVPNFTDPEKIGIALYFYLLKRQFNSLSLDVLQKVFAWMLLDDATVTKSVVVTEIPTLRSSLDQQNPVPLVLIRGKGVSDPTHNHQVLAVGYRLDEDNQVLTIDLYDPNHPGEQPNLSMNLSNPDQGIALAQSSQEALRGFFVARYEKSIPP